MPKLLQRPPLKPDEWWDAYVARALAENGHAATREHTIGKLEPIVAQLVPAAVRQRAQAGALLGEGLRAYAQWALPAWAVRGSLGVAAYCPICFQYDPYVRLGWRLRGVTHCAEHGCSLVTRCGTCSRNILHWDLARQHCRCGAALGHAQVAHEMSTAADARSTVSADWLFCAQDVHSASTPLEGQSEDGCPESLVLIVLLGTLLPSLVTVRLRGLDDKACTIGGFLKGLNLTLTLTRQWVEQLLTSLQSAAHLRAALNLVLALWHQEQTSKSVLGDLPLYDWASKLCELGASPSTAERRGFIPAGTLRRGLVPMKVAAHQAGLSPMHLHDLMGKGSVAPVRTLDVGGRQHLFSQAQVVALARFRNPGYGYGMSLDLGLDHGGLVVLRMTGIVNLVKDSSGARWLDGGELRALLATLEARAKVTERVDGLKLNLGSRCIWHTRNIPALKMLFTRLCAGETPVWACGDQPGFARFFIGVEALELLHRGVARAERQALDIEAQQVLSLPDGTASWSLVRPSWRQRPPLRCSPGAASSPHQLALEFA